jgi:hypothetical protein
MTPLAAVGITTILIAALFFMPGLLLNNFQHFNPEVGGIVKQEYVKGGTQHGF